MKYPEIMTREQALTAMILWENIEHDDTFRACIDQHGICEARDACIRLAYHCDRDYFSKSHEQWEDLEIDCFDLEFVPRWIDKCVTRDLEYQLLNRW